MQCPTCSATLPEDAAFCSECGNKTGSVVNTPKPRPDPLLGGTIVVPKAGGHDGMSALEPDMMFADRYKIESVLGSGGMGVVYKATDTISHQTVALKLINAQLLKGHDAVERLINEGVTTRNIQHRNVVNVYDVGRAGDQPYLSMEYLDGQSLRAWLGRQLVSGREVSVEAATGIVRAILDGVGEAHSNTVIHRDLKPENIMLLGDPENGDFRLKVLDFGIARSVNTSAFTSSASALGTLPYMAPEQKTTPDAAGPAADIYSISRILYELLMDVLPDGPWQPPSQHRSDVPASLDALLEKGLSNRPRSRQQSVAEYRAALDDAMAAAVTRAPLADNDEPERGRDEPEPSRTDGLVDRKPSNAIMGAIEAYFKKDGRWNLKRIGQVVGIGLLAAFAVQLIEDTPAENGTGGSTFVESGGPLQGYWINTSQSLGSTCVRWQVTQSGNNISGQTVLRNGAPLTFTGTASGPRVSGSIMDPSSGRVIEGFSGAVTTDNQGYSHISMPSGMMHINHTHPGATC